MEPSGPLDSRSVAIRESEGMEPSGPLDSRSVLTKGNMSKKAKDRKSQRKVHFEQTFLDEYANEESGNNGYMNEYVGYLPTAGSH